MTIDGRYGDCDDREEGLEQLAFAAGADVVEFGRSVDDRPIRAAVVPTTASQLVPTVLVDANLHGVEWIGAQCALGVLDALAKPQGALVRERAVVVVAPCLNPDGAARTQLQAGRGTLKELRTNARGVDLNRNFPLPHGAQPFFLTASGSSNPAAATYRGTAAFSEPESKSVDALAQQHAFHAVVSFHSFMGTLIPPKVTSSSEA